ECPVAPRSLCFGRNGARPAQRILSLSRVRPCNLQSHSWQSWEKKIGKKVATRKIWMLDHAFFLTEQIPIQNLSDLDRLLALMLHYTECSFRNFAIHLGDWACGSPGANSPSSK